MREDRGLRVKGVLTPRPQGVLLNPRVQLVAMQPFTCSVSYDVKFERT